MEDGKMDSDNQICRICMAPKPNQVSIFNELNLSLKLMELADVQVRQPNKLDCMLLSYNSVGLC